MTDLRLHLAPHARSLSSLRRGFASSATTTAPASGGGALVFVNRRLEAFTIAEVNIRNKVLRQSEHPTLVTAGQMFGAGKSELGVHAVARAGEDGVKKRLLKAFANHDAVNDYLTATTVRVDLDSLGYLGTGMPSVTQFAGAMLWESLSAQGFELGPLPSPSPLLPDVVKRYQEACVQAGRPSGLFIHWDEVSEIHLLCVLSLSPSRSSRPSDGVCTGGRAGGTQAR